MTIKLAVSFLTACLALSAQADDGKIHDTLVNDNDGPLVTDAYPEHIQKIISGKPYLKCAPLDGKGPDSDANKEVNLYNDILAQSKTGTALLEDAKELSGHIWVCPNDISPGVGGSFSRMQNIVYLNRTSSGVHKVSILAHELRHATQFSKNGLSLLDDERKYYQSQAREADAQTIATAVVWELKEANLTSIWEETKALFGTYGNMDLAFSEAKDGWGSRFDRAYAMFQDWWHDHEDGHELKAIEHKQFRNAMQAAYKAWFENGDIVEAYQLRTLDIMLTDKQLKQLKQLSKELCKKAQAYGNEDDCSKYMTAKKTNDLSDQEFLDLIRELGDVPGHGFNYLKPEKGEEEIVTSEAIKKAVPSFHTDFMP